MTTTTTADELLYELLPELRGLDEQEAECTARLARITATTEVHRSAVASWQAASHAAALTGESMPPRPAPPYADAPLAVRALMDARLDVQRRRREVLREHAADALAGLNERLQPTVSAAAVPVRKLEQLAEQAASAHEAATRVCASAGLPTPAPLTAAALVQAVDAGRPLLAQRTVPDPPDPEDRTPAGVGSPMLQRAQRVA